MIAAALAAALLLTGCQTTGATGTVGGPQTAATSEANPPLPRQCQGVLVPNSPLWTELTGWRGFRPACRTIGDNAGRTGFQYMAVAKSMPTAKEIAADYNLGRSAAASRLLVIVVRFYGRIQDVNAYYASQPMGKDILPTLAHPDPGGARSRGGPRHAV